MVVESNKFDKSVKNIIKKQIKNTLVNRLENKPKVRVINKVKYRCKGELLNKFVSVVYLLMIGCVGDGKIREKMKISKNIPDNYIVVKYGYSKDYKNRHQTHTNYFSKIEGSNLSELFHALINNPYQSIAETEVKNKLKEMNVIFVDFDNSKEIVIITEEQKEELYQFYNDLANKYMKNTNSLIEENKILKEEKEKLLTECKIYIFSINETHRKDIEEKENLIENLKEKLWSCEKINNKVLKYHKKYNEKISSLF